MPIASVKQFIDNFPKHKISKSTQFRLLGFYGVPDYVQKEFSEDGGIYYLKSGKVPKRTLGGIEVMYQGFKLDTPGQVEYESPHSFTFRTPEDFLWRNALEQWNFDIYNEITGNGLGYPCESAYFDIGLVADSGRIIRIYRFFNVWPKTVGEIQYDISDAPKEVEFTVDISFSRWSVVGVTDSGELDDATQSDEQKAIFEQYRNVIESAKATCTK